MTRGHNVKASRLTAAGTSIVRQIGGSVSSSSIFRRMTESLMIASVRGASSSLCDISQDFASVATTKLPCTSKPDLGGGSRFGFGE